MTKEEIYVIGEPFSVYHSSCSNRTPEKFSWSSDGNHKKYAVYLDRAIPSGISNKLSQADIYKKYAWLCESRAICPEIRAGFENESLVEEVTKGYEAIFTCEKDLVDKFDNVYYCFAGSNLPWTPVSDYKIHDKQKLISFISSAKRMCYGHEIRHSLLEKIKNRTKKETAIDVYGGAIGTSFGIKHGCHLPGYPGNAWHDKSLALNDYMFSIAMENDVYDTYFTEKLTDCFATGTIPLYYGPRSIDEYFNTDGIIFLEGSTDEMYNIISQISPSMYVNRLDAIKDNFERVKNMQSADDMLYEKIKEVDKTNELKDLQILKNNKRKVK